jgi:hypothetical protein
MKLDGVIAVLWRPCWKWQIFWKFWKRRIAPLMVTYHYVKFYVSIIIHLEVININVRNFNFQYRTNSTLFDIIKITYVGRLWWPELIPDVEKCLPVSIFKMVASLTRQQISYSGSTGWYFRYQSIHIQTTYTYI